MSIGLVCQYLEPHIKRSGIIEYKNVTNEKSLQYNQFLANRYTKDHILSIWLNNCNGLYSIIRRIEEEGIKVFRISSSLLPLYDKVPELKSNDDLKNILKSIGDFVISHNMRITIHPDQFVVLSSNKENVNQNSIAMLEHYGWLFDNMGLPKSPYYCINIHGGVKGNTNILVENINKLSDSVKSRLTLENDEKSYNILELFSVNKETGVPIVLDSHHYSFNTANISLQKSFSIAIQTWGKVKSIMHLSNTEPECINGNFAERRKHSNYVHYIPDIYKQLNNQGCIDIDFEFKMKNFAIKKAVEEFGIEL